MDQEHGLRTYGYGVCFGRLRLSWERVVIDLSSPESSTQNADIILESIAIELRSMVPLEAILPSEHIREPFEDSSYDMQHCIHVDSFLYDDDDFDDMCSDGKVPRFFCKDCDSRNTEPLEVISHSLSRTRLKYIFQAMLPPLEHLTLLDVGSRLGAVLYGAFLYTNAAKIIGVEINSDFCKLQTETIRKHSMQQTVELLPTALPVDIVTAKVWCTATDNVIVGTTVVPRWSQSGASVTLHSLRVLCGQDRVQVVNTDIVCQPELVSSADVVVLNNVFQFFLELDKQADMWRFLRSSVKPGTILVTIPALHQVLVLDQAGIDLSQWVEEIPLHNVHAVTMDKEDLEDVKHYRVK
uniref:Methyltransferase type 11 domain-containing protein n=1 Tax=Timema bartmani TaxID=61472 RepID=A0A7R9EVJ1_9NEOP|nr:unnamed protein product [Timema bartmani]